MRRYKIAFFIALTAAVLFAARLVTLLSKPVSPAVDVSDGFDLRATLLRPRLQQPNPDRRSACDATNRSFFRFIDPTADAEQLV